MLFLRFFLFFFTNILNFHTLLHERRTMFDGIIVCFFRFTVICRCHAFSHWLQMPIFCAMPMLMVNRTPTLTITIRLPHD